MLIEMEKHQPVLLKEVIEHLNLGPNKNVVDANVGYGGHAMAMLHQIAPKGRLLGIDLDAEAIKYTKETFSKIKEFEGRYILVQENFTNIKEIVVTIPNFFPHAILFDLGLSSAQLADPARGFSFRHEESLLDMRFDTSEGVSARHIINRSSRDELERILKEYGEVRFAGRIARKIIEMRKKRLIDTPFMLVEAVSSAYKNLPFKLGLLARDEKIQKIFQAFRIAVNHEIENLNLVLPRAIEVLQPKGRIAVISFHGLEDRIVKHCFRRESKDCVCPPEIPVCRCGHTATVKIITKKPLIPTNEEISLNPRARSAKLRVAEKL